MISLGSFMLKVAEAILGRFPWGCCGVRAIVYCHFLIKWSREYKEKWGSVLPLYCSENSKGVLSDPPDVKNLLPACKRSSASRVPGRDSAGGTELLPFDVEKKQTHSAISKAKLQRFWTFLLVHLLKICLKTNSNSEGFWLCCYMSLACCEVRRAVLLRGVCRAEPPGPHLSCQHPSHSGYGARPRVPPAPENSEEAEGHRR